MRAAIVLLAAAALAGCASSGVSSEATAEYERARDLYREGRIAESMAAAHRAVAIDPRATKAHWLLATIHEEQGEWRAAIFELQKVMENTPNEPLALAAANRAGEILIRNGDRVRAREAFRGCLELSPDYPPALINLGVMEIEDGNAEAALPHLERAVELVPTHGNGHVQLARAYAELGREDDFRASLTRAIDCRDLPEERKAEIRKYLDE